ncbi:DNA topoisomerase I, mitochondrial-like isoform X1 [Asterias amurensis]|uniref:DNA topoisomerase I, mitochondrial-like isoform X1 n=1 Tax=Asterias amurensis TaxID=7602 RepID=UPI003AB6932F
MNDSVKDIYMSSPKVASSEKSSNALKQQNHMSVTISSSSPKKLKQPSSGMTNDHHSNSKPKISSSLSKGSRPNDGHRSPSSSRPKEGANSHSLPNSDGKPASKPNGGSGSHSTPKHSSSSKPKEGSLSHSSSKPKDSSHARPKDGHSSSKVMNEGSSSGQKPKINSTSRPSSDKLKEKSKDPSKLSASTHKSSQSVPSSKGREGSSSLKHKDPSSKSKDPSLKPKDSSSKPREGSNKSHSKPLPSKDNAHSGHSHVSKDKVQSKSPSSGSERPRHQDGKSSSSDSDFKKSSVNHENHKSDKDSNRVKVTTEKNREHVAKINIKVEKGKEAKIVKSPVKIKKEVAVAESDEDNRPLDKRLAVEKVKKESASRPSLKRPLVDSDDEKPLSARVEKAKKQKVESASIKKEKPTEKHHKRKYQESDDEEPKKKVSKQDVKKSKDKSKGSDKTKEKGSKKKGKKEEEAEEVWKWWEEEPHPEGVKWIFLEHKGPVFAPPYEPLPDDVKFYYDGKLMKLSENAEEVAGFYARMLDHEYTTREVFNKNFFNDWRKEMTGDERKTITNLKKCNFKELHQYFLQKSEERRNLTKEEKLANKNKNEELLQEYGFCTIDGHREKMGNFKIEPPGLFRGRGDHPKQGMHKKRVQPENVIINCSKDSTIPVAPEGHRWKQVIHDNSVTWLCSWNENIQGAIKYVMLNPSSRLKGEKDWAKYETARKLKKCVEKIRANYREDFKSKEMRIRQRAVALYFIDKLALRAGNEKEEGESADTVGCCSLRVEHLKLHEEKNGQEFVVEFDFLGKDSIRYQNSVPVEKRAFRNLKLFMENKQGSDDLFDRLTTSILNKHLQELMEGLTAKVFRTYNASSTLQNQLDELTMAEDSIPAKILSYNRANRAVAILCNHQRAAPKTFDKQMENLQTKIKAKHEAIKKARKEFKAMKTEYKSSRNDKIKTALERKKTQVERLEEQLTKLEMNATDKEENKEIALGTSKLNYLDPRISVAWTKKWTVPMEKIYNRTQRDKFRWAIDMAGADFVF